MQPHHGDPLDWTVDEVVDFLCHNPQTPWSLSDTPIPRPDPASLEATLRDNLITGEVLLQDVDKDALQNDLHLKKLGHRSCIMKAIQYLQLHSPKYQQSHGQFPRFERTSSPSIISSTPHPHYSSPQVAPIHHLPSANPPSFKVSSQGATSPLPSTRNLIGISAPTGKSAPVGSPIASNASSPRKHVENSTEFSISIRPQERVFVDNHGRKRRRLNLGTPLLGTQNESLTSKFPSDKTGTMDWYMGPEKLTPAQLFYPSIPAEEESNFSMINPKIPIARRLFANRSLSRFFHQTPVRLNSEETSTQLAMIPFPPTMVNDTSQKFFTLYTEKNGGVTTSKEHIKDWPQLNFPQSKKDKTSPDDQRKKQDDFYLHLLDKYREDSGEALPLYGDSGSEGAFDDETWLEIDDENKDSGFHKPTKMGPMEVDSIIQNYISEAEDSWHKFSQPKEQNKARRLWLSAKRERRTNGEIKALTNEILRLESSLKRLQKAVRENEYTSSKELRTQCKSLEETISNIQKQKWRRLLLEQSTCPPKISIPSRPKYPPTSRQGDEESLYSESDYASTGSLDDFLDDSEIPNQFFEYSQPVEQGQSVEQRSPSPAPSFSEGDDDVISVSGIRRRSRAQRHRFFATSSPSPQPPTENQPSVIDLTMESPELGPEPDELTIETPPLNPVQAIKSETRSERSNSISPVPSLGSTGKQDPPTESNRQQSQSLPEPQDFDDILLVPWDLLERRRDRRRLLAKLIACLSSEERNRLRKRIPKYLVIQLRKLTKSALRALRQGRESVRHIDSFENQIVMRTASLFISWVNCVHLQLQGIPKIHIENTQANQHEFQPFFYELCERLRDSRAWEPKKNSTKTPKNSMTSEPANLVDSPHKKRKREVKESQEVKLNQESAQRRVARQDEQRKKLEQRLGSINNDNPDLRPVSFGSPVIYLHPHIGGRVKPHQLNGIQFMWRELIEDRDQKGCLLAHTMGLGKTMQVISLLVTISAAATSTDPKIRGQVPEEFHRSQTLVLCPPSLIENWHEEFLMWTPEDSKIGPVRRVLSNVSLSARLEEVSSWNTEGGVLLISYEMFRTWIINKETKRGKCLTERNHEKIKLWLLESPNIVVADEAHKMKNPTSAITAAATRFRTKSRIALTGSPLANSLTDYFTMVDWIAEGFLGQFIAFKANYIEPIEEGLYVDSTHGERRRSLVKLQVLKRNLDPKINRADITVLEGSLPPKVEFVITVPLSLLQKKAYDLYVSSVLSGVSDDVANTRIWTWLAILGYCCHHPACFRDKILSQNKRLEESEQEFLGDVPITQAGIEDVTNLVSAQERLFASVQDMKALDLSPRAEILNRIIDESIAAGDKVLVFSQSLPTLNFVEHMLKISNRGYCRLDGSTPVSTRQEAVKKFNIGFEKQVYLISTRAGGLGLNIPGANRVVIFDFSFNPIWEEQAVGRAYRLGQEKPVYVYRFIAGGTFEELIHQRAVFKTQLAYRVVDKKNPIRYASKKLGEYLFPAKAVPQEDVSEFIGKDPEVLDKIILEQNGKVERLIRSITLTQTFQKESNDKLTEEENQGVEQELNEERLRRTDPEAYARLMAERQARQLYMSAPQFPPPSSSLQPSPSLQYFAPSSLQQPSSRQSLVYNPPVPLNAHSHRPPALAPDTSLILRPTNPISSPTTPNPFAPQMPVFHPSDSTMSAPPLRESLSIPLPSAGSPRAPHRTPGTDDPFVSTGQQQTGSTRV